MILDKKKIFQGGKTKLTFENLIFPRIGFVYWWNLHLSMCDYLNPVVPNVNKRSYINKPVSFIYMFV